MHALDKTLAFPSIIIARDSIAQAEKSKGTLSPSPFDPATAAIRTLKLERNFKTAATRTVIAIGVAERVLGVSILFFYEL